VLKNKLAALVDFMLGNDNGRLKCICVFSNSIKRVLKCQNLKVFEVVMTRWAFNGDSNLVWHLQHHWHHY
jgi:hypothetical protein